MERFHVRFDGNTIQMEIQQGGVNGNSRYYFYSYRSFGLCGADVFKDQQNGVGRRVRLLILQWVRGNKWTCSTCKASPRVR